MQSSIDSIPKEYTNAVDYPPGIIPTTVVRATV